MSKQKNKSKSGFNATLKYDKFSDALNQFIIRNCVPATMDWDVNALPLIPSEIRIVVHATGSGYIHLLGRDSETIDFKDINA